jgi:pyroglutamyl-peptidase
MILVTGFGPYREDMNASGALVSSLKDDLPDALDHLKGLLAFEVVTCDDTSRETEHLSLETRLDELLKRYEPELCIHTGQAPPYNKITVERIATNSFMRAVIDPGRPVAYWSNLPGTEGLSTALEAHGIPAGESFYAGQHLCNHILYSSRYFAEKNALHHKSGFIHVPVLPEQARQHRNAPTMPLDMSRKALSIIINQVVKAHREN